MRTILQIILLILLICGLVYMVVDPIGEIREQRDLQRKVNKAVYEAQEVREIEFCKKYMKIVPDINMAPYAYRHCFKTK